MLEDVKALADALGARRDPDVQLAALAALAAALPAADRAGLEAFADASCAEQQDGNATLAAALKRWPTERPRRPPGGARAARGAA